MDEDPLPTASHATTFTGSSPLFGPQTYAHKSSSPRPFFSDNDSLDAADVTIYESPRLKRKRAGTWWQRSPMAAPNKKRQFKRNTDSGVHMMSDDSSASTTSSSAHSSFGFDGTSDFPSDPPAPEHEDEGFEHATQAMTDREAEFYVDILKTVEANVTAYTLENRDVEDSWLSHLQMLNQVVRVSPDASTEVPDEGQYRSMEPELYLNLSSNRLCGLSPTLFQLQYLTSLTLRNNTIEAIPPQIAQLTNLKALDLCHNSIRTLPAELLSLCEPQGNLTRLHLAGNPLCEVGDSNNTTFNGVATPAYNMRFVFGQKLLPEESFSALAKATEGPQFSSDLLARTYRHATFSWNDFKEHHRFTPPNTAAWENANPQESMRLPRNDLHLVTRTTAAYYDQGGRLVKNCPPLPTQERASHQPLNGPRTQPGLMVHTNLGVENVPAVWFDRPSRSKVSSLFSQCLATAYKWCEGDPNGVEGELRAYLAEEGEEISGDTEASLAIADRNIIESYKPLRACHCCDKEFVVARAEWIEGWFFNQQIVPIKVAVCSWGCVPDIIALRPEPLKWLDVG